ncbi:ricin-type beta-trefoil lectin domain protein [Streptomyces sp. NPDC005931]|uniref:ricin-type beta-trefoil lectin domain protein n=1 Tax=Streptomyces sp. NPDC005931 TaxID=3364737 RepID=UPI0036CD108E
MARADGTDDGSDDGTGREVEAAGEAHAGASDARLTELLRADTGTAYAALRELRARHSPSVLAYARLCTAGDASARQLAAQAFTRAAREVARGTDGGGPLRHRLLLLAGKLAAAWATDDRSGALDPGLLLVVNTAGPGGPVPPLLTAFRNLPPRAQGLIWYGVVDREPDERTATLLGIDREDVAHGTRSALQTLARSCLRARLAASDDPSCGGFRRLIEESVRPDHPRDSADLHTHMAHCPHCTAAYEEQRALRRTPRTALAEGLLPWAGTAYVTGDPDEAVPPSRAAEPAWPPSRRLALASAALGVALTPLVLFLLSGGSGDQEPVSAAHVPTAPPVTVTATVAATPSMSPSPSSSPSPSAPSASAAATSPAPSRTASPSRTPSPEPTPEPSPTYPPGSAFAQVVNVASGLCLDIRDGFLEKGNDVVMARCTSSPTQRWRVDSGRGVVQSFADTDYCLDSRGSVERGVGIWVCDSVDGRNGLNLRFAVDGDGRIRPGIAYDTAVTPEGPWLALRSLDGRTEQRWRAGAR